MTMPETIDFTDTSWFKKSVIGTVRPPQHGAKSSCRRTLGRSEDRGSRRGSAVRHRTGTPKAMVILRSRR